MNEDQFVARIRRMAALAAGRRLILGIGDDCAIYRPKRGEELVFTTDLFIENIHFRLRDHQPAALGRRALARSLSDVAAMGAVPRFCLVSLALSKRTDAKWAEAFYRGLIVLAQETGIALAGGDLSHAARVVCDVMVCGSVGRGKALRRDGACPGDSIYVSGALGGWRYREEIVPKLDIARRIASRATAAIDITDGVSADLRRLCVASGVAASLDAPLPVLEGATLDEALHAGEDYELLYTASRGVRVPGIRVGHIIEGRPGDVFFMGLKVAARGYDHLDPARR